MDSNVELFMGKRILIVEDEYLVAQETRRMLEKLGAIVVGPVSKVEDGMDLAHEAKIDAAILDINLDGEMVFPLADLLESMHIPFVFATGYDPSFLPERYGGYVLCEKPAHLDVIARALFAPASPNH